MNSTTVRNLLFVTGAKIVAAIAGLIGIRVFTELAPPSVFGEVSLVLGFLTLGFQVFVAPITEAQIRLYPNHLQEGTSSVFSSIIFRLAQISALTLVSICWAILALGVGAATSMEPLPLALVLAGFIFASTVKELGLSRINIEHRQARFAVWSATEPIVLVLLGGCFLWMSPQPISLLSGHFGAIFLTTALFIGTGPHPIRSLYSIEPINKKLSNRILRDIRVFGWPFIVFGILGWVLNLFERYALSSLLDMDAVGKYVAVFTIGSQLVLLPSTILAAVFRPILYDAAASKNIEVWRRVAWIWSLLLAIGGTILLAGIWLWADFFLPFILAVEYLKQAQYLMFIIAVAYVLRVYVQLLEMLLFSFHPPSLMIFPKALGAVSNVVAAVTLIPLLGVYGAASAAVITSVTMLFFTAMRLFFANRRSEK